MWAPMRRWRPKAAAQHNIYLQLELLLNLALSVSKVVLDYGLDAGTDTAALAAKGVQLLSTGRDGGIIADLAACLGVTQDGHLSLCNVPEGQHTLHLPRLGQV